jgi:hypothetical protein
MEGVVGAIYAPGPILLPFGELVAAAWYFDLMPYILHLTWKEEVFIKASKRSVYLFT